MKYAWLLILLLASACDKNTPEDGDTTDPINDTTNVLGYGILNDFSGIWDGPVSSTTALGGYPEWIVDFRPVSPAQLSGKAELDTVNDIFMGFFIAKTKTQYVVAFRNGGGFAGQQRVLCTCNGTQSALTLRRLKLANSTSIFLKNKR